MEDSKTTRLIIGFLVIGFLMGFAVGIIIADNIYSRQLEIINQRVEDYLMEVKKPNITFVNPVISD